MKRNKYATLFICILLLCAILLNLASCSLKQIDTDDKTVDGQGSSNGNDDEKSGDSLNDGDEDGKNTASKDDENTEGTESEDSKTVDLLANITADNVEAILDLSIGNVAATEFAVELFKKASGNGNTLVSPLSVLYALSMTANGADNETLRQMEAVLGMNIDELNKYLYTYLDTLPSDDRAKFSIANSIWFKDDERFSARNEFLQSVSNYYQAEIYKAPFDETTLEDVNNWVSDKTDGMIPEVLDKINPDTIMYLINALCFEAEWTTPYKDYQVRDAKFTTESGEKQNIELMYSTLYSYLEDDMAKGFVKNYKGADYAFVALLPNEGISLEQYISSLDGQRLGNLLSNIIGTKVETAIPKFEMEFSIEMSEILSYMGMSDAFDENAADFSAIGECEKGNIFISQVIHKTYIEIAEKGTKAGASTVVSADNATSAPPTEQPKRVYLDRPFVFMLIDCENNIPFFIGAVTDMG